jgi:hypothetical protein
MNTKSLIKKQLQNCGLVESKLYNGYGYLSICQRFEEVEENINKELFTIVECGAANNPVLEIHIGVCSGVALQHKRYSKNGKPLFTCDQNKTNKLCAKVLNLFTFLGFQPYTASCTDSDGNKYDHPRIYLLRDNPNIYPQKYI